VHQWSESQEGWTDATCEGVGVVVVVVVVVLVVGLAVAVVVALISSIANTQTNIDIKALARATLTYCKTSRIKCAKPVWKMLRC
jgi:flagellar biosynthesis protein FliQ